MVCYNVPKLLASCLLVMPSLPGCTISPGSKLPINARLIAKYQVLDEVLSPHHTKCGEVVKEFVQAGPYDCSFSVQGLEFDIEKKYSVDGTGHLQEFRTYLAEGPVMYGPRELAADSAFVRCEGLSIFHIALITKAGSILDGTDTVAIERIFWAEKLILARRSPSQPPGRRFIYQYQL